MSTAVAAPIDPFASLVNGRYRDDLVEVRRFEAPPPDAVHTRSFSLWTEHGRVQLCHRIPPEDLDNDLAGVLATELFEPGWLAGNDLFERLMTGVVLTSAPRADAAWSLFYSNTLTRLDASDPAARTGEAAASSLTEFAPVYRRVLDLVPPGPVLELGSCFGFLALQVGRRRPTTASDISRNTMRLLRRVAPGLGIPLRTLACDASRVPAPARSFSTVLAVHLLEHVTPDHGADILAEMQRLAAHRVVIAVPFEEEPTAAYGHVRAFDLDELASMAHGTHWHATTFEHHGGWLVLDRR